MASLLRQREEESLEQTRVHVSECEIIKWYQNDKMRDFKLVLNLLLRGSLVGAAV